MELAPKIGPSTCRSSVHVMRTDGLQQQSENSQCDRV